MKHLAALQNLAVAAVRDLLTNPDTPPSVRLRAANLVFDAAAASIESEPAAAAIEEPPAPFIPASNKPYVALPSTPGRNETCTCGSGLKYKKCCLLKKHAPFAFPATRQASAPAP